MARGHVFVTYTSVDPDRVQLLVDRLTRAGLDTIADPRLDGVEGWTPQDSMATTASVVIVAFGKGAARGGSDHRAESAMTAGALIPVMLEPDATPPPWFGGLQAIDLSGWSGGDHPQFERLAGHVRALVERRESRLEPGGTLADDWVLSSSEQAIGELQQLTRRVGSLGEVLVGDADPVRDLRAALREIGATYRAVNRAIRRFMEAGVDPDAIDRRAYVALEREDLVDTIHTGRGSCDLIATHYYRSGGLQDALEARASDDVLADADAAFETLGAADRDLFDDMERLGRSLSNESRAIVNLLMTGQDGVARQRIVEGRERLLALEERLRRAREEFQTIQRDLGYAEESPSEGEAVQVTVQNITIAGDVVGSNVVVAETIESSVLAVANADIPAELAATLKDLHKAVAALTTALPDDEAALTARDLEDLTKEATSPTPRPAFWRRAADGLLTTAKRVADAGGPVVDLVTKVVVLLGG